MRAMMRMFTTTYGESVSCTPICAIGEPIGPMLNGSTYIVRPRMQPSNSSLQLAPHFVGIDPVVGRAGVVLRQRADERAVLDARHVARVGPRVVTARPELLVELDERAARNHLRAQRVVFLLRSVDPMDEMRLRERRDLLDPLEQMLVLRQRVERGVAGFGSVGLWRGVMRAFSSVTDEGTGVSIG